MAEKPEEKKARSQGNRNPKHEAEVRKPDSNTVADYHANSDVDAHTGAQHHTLGFGASQASPGDHNHNANSPDSVPLWTSVTLADPTATSSTTELANAISALNALIRQKSSG